MSSIKRVRACGRFLHNNDSGFQVKVSGAVADGTRRAGLGGVQSCGSVWSCPVCAEKIQAERQAAVATALSVARLRGWEVLFLTLTMRHARDHRLVDLWGHLSVGWRKTTGGSYGWKGDKRDFGIAGYLRLVEVTHGESGWHVHVHALLFIDPARAEVLTPTLGGAQTGAQGLTNEHVDELGGRMFARWRDSFGADRRLRPSQSRGSDIRRVRSDDVIAGYFAKNMYDRKGEGSTAHDVTGAHGKDAKNGNRTPFGILKSLVDLETGEVSSSYDRDLELWQTYEQVSKGKRQLLWSRGLKDELGLDEDRDDQEIVDEDMGGELVEVGTAVEWEHIARRHLIAPLLEAAEADETGERLAHFLNVRVRPQLPGF